MRPDRSGCCKKLNIHTHFIKMAKSPNWPLNDIAPKEIIFGVRCALLPSFHLLRQHPRWTTNKIKFDLPFHYPGIIQSPAPAPHPPLQSVTHSITKRHHPPPPPPAPTNTDYPCCESRYLSKQTFGPRNWFFQHTTAPKEYCPAAADDDLELNFCTTWFALALSSGWFFPRNYLIDRISSREIRLRQGPYWTDHKWI